MSPVRKSFALMVIATFCVTAAAAPWSTFGPKRKPETLVITANYVSPRLMAELIQHESGQPYLLLPAEGDEDQRIFLCPRNNKETIVIPENEIGRFVDFLGSKRIIVLGNQNYVPEKYVNMLNPNTPVVRVTGNDWERIAEELKFMLNLSKMHKNFKKLRAKMITPGRLYRPLRANAPAANTAANTAAEAAPEAVPAAQEQK